MRPRDHWLSTKLMAFFESSQDEELTIRQVCTKFDVPYTTARNVVVKLSKAGKLEDVRVVRLREKGIAK